ncbi:MAG: Ig-like domain-containing protein, partial [Deinococcus sp.]|nr:Ig-like domain-containing protein [Deinococcus sp.]
MNKSTWETRGVRLALLVVFMVILSSCPAFVDVLAPLVSITAPTAGASLGSTPISVTADASDDVGVTVVEFFVDGASLGTDTTAPYEASWAVTVADEVPHVLTATASDEAGNTATSAEVMVTVSLLDPTVAIASPAPDTALGSAPVLITAEATGNDGTEVTEVEFFVDGVSIGVDDTPTRLASRGALGFSIGWTFTPTQNGSHSLTAKATDGAGNSATTLATPVMTFLLGPGSPTVSSISGFVFEGTNENRAGTPLVGATVSVSTGESTTTGA